MGRKASLKAVQMLKEQVSWINSKDLIALSNAGYAEVYSEVTMGALDGLSRTLGVSRGDNSLVEIHSAAGKGPLVCDLSSTFRLLCVSAG